jgi:hypothetical protein
MYLFRTKNNLKNVMPQSLKEGKLYKRVLWFWCSVLHKTDSDLWFSVFLTNPMIQVVHSLFLTHEANFCHWLLLLTSATNLFYKFLLLSGASSFCYWILTKIYAEKTTNRCCSVRCKTDSDLIMHISLF